MFVTHLGQHDRVVDDGQQRLGFGYSQMPDYITQTGIICQRQTDGAALLSTVRHKLSKAAGQF